MENVETIASSDELSSKTRIAAELKQKKEAVELELSLVEAEFKKVSSEILNMLEALDINSIKTSGYNFYIEEKESVKTPKTLEEKRLLFEYLKSLGMYDEMVSINSQTLNSLFKTMSEKAASEGVLDFQMPGIEPATSYKNLKMRKI